MGGAVMEAVDRKFRIHAMCNEHGHVHSEADAVLFLAKDRALPETLQFYLGACARLGAAPRQLLGIRLLIERVERWQNEHENVLKVADVDEGPTGDLIVRANELPPA